MRNYLNVIFLFSFFIVSLLLLSSCGTTRDSYYFKEIQKDTSVHVFINNDGELKIRRADVISILVSSLDKTEDELYNTPVSTSSNASNSSEPSSAPASYEVDESGNILMHKLGKIHVEGLTLSEVKEKLQKDFLPYLKDPIVTVSFASHKVTILGQVSRPQIITLGGNSLSVLDAFALSGDVTATADLRNVLIVREKDSIKEFKHINLENARFMDSSCYYLQPDDIVYVMPDYKKIRRQERKSDIQQNIAILASLATLIIIIVDRIH